MLLQFSVENFLSFDAMTHFSMRASDETDHPNHVLTRGSHRAVRGAALYGANAAGKSNLVLAMGFARDVIVKGAPLSGVRPFRLRDGANRPSGFHWQWIHAGKKWSYGFDISTTRVVEEYLFAEPEDGGEEEVWFERKADEPIELGEALLGDESSEDAQLLNLTKNRTDADELFLRHCLNNKISAVLPVFEWFEDVLLIVRAESGHEPLILEATENEDFLSFLSDQIKDAGTGIIKVFASKQTVEEAINSFPEDLRGQANTALHGIIDKMKAGSSNIDSGDTSFDVSVVIHKDDAGQAFIKALHPFHNNINQNKWEVFSWKEESEGTQRYLHLLPRLYRLQTRPTVLVIDELERRLHTHLTRRFVDQSLSVSPLPDSQLIFTTHDTNLLDSALLRRDEIWFVDKNESGASSLFSLASFSDFDSPDYERAYLLGLFEAIPYFRNSHQLSPALRAQPETPAS